MSPRPASEIPGLRPIPFVGRHLGLLRLFRDPLRVLPRLWREHGEIAALSRGDPSIVCAFGPAFHQQLLPRAKEFEHLDDIPMRVPEGSALSRTLFNLTVINGADHRRQRRLMMPAFGRSVIHGYHATPSWYASDCTHPNSLGHDQLRRLVFEHVTGESLP